MCVHVACIEYRVWYVGDVSYAACDVCVHGDAVSLGRKYVFATVMCLVLPMCILISCSSVLCVLKASGMFVKVMLSLISVMSPPSLFVLSVCAYGCVVG